MVKHHEREAPIALKGVIDAKPDDSLPFPFLEPEIARDRRIMLVDFSVPPDPVVELAFPDGKPGDKAGDRNLGFGAPCVREIDDGVSRIMGNPDAC